MTFATFRGLLGLAFLLTCGGAGLIWWGNSEQKLSARSTVDPLAVDLAKLEAGEPLPSNHITIGPHYACYYSTVYSYRTKKNAKDTVPGDDTKLEYVLYPIVSTTHPQVKELIGLAKPNDKAKNAAVEDDTPPIEHFAVVVKTERFKKLADIPDTLRREESIHGLVINEVRSLDAKETKLLKESFPKMDLKQVHVLEEGRTPSSSTTSWLAILGGISGVALGVVGALVVIILGVISLFRR